MTAGVSGSLGLESGCLMAVQQGPPLNDVGGAALHTLLSDLTATGGLAHDPRHSAVARLSQRRHRETLSIRVA